MALLTICLQLLVSVTSHWAQQMCILLTYYYLVLVILVYLLTVGVSRGREHVINNFLSNKATVNIREAHLGVILHCTETVLILIKEHFDNI